MLAAASTRSVVPPTARTFGNAAGYDAGAPLSPDDARNVTPAWPVGVRKELSNVASPENSPPPKLIDTATTPGRLAAKRTAANKFESEASFASTSKILAFGAM